SASPPSCSRGACSPRRRPPSGGRSSPRRPPLRPAAGPGAGRFRMPTRDQLVAALRSGRSYEQAGEDFGIPPGQAYMIVTGLPADGSDVLGPELLERKKEFLLDGGSQHLANPA